MLTFSCPCRPEVEWITHSDGEMKFVFTVQSALFFLWFSLMIFYGNITDLNCRRWNRLRSWLVGWFVSLLFRCSLLYFSLYDWNKNSSVRSWMPIVLANNDRNRGMSARSWLRPYFKLVLNLSLLVFIWICLYALLFIFCFTKDDDVGTVYQDKDTMAAVLVNHDAEDDALILVTLLLVFL